jgi:lysozyme
MKTSQKGINLIKKFEGLASKAYLCPAGVWTVGYGHTKGVKPDMVISELQADYFLKEDVVNAENAINKHGLHLNQNQFDALVSFVFNLGAVHFQNSILLTKIKANPNDPAIRAEFTRWRFAGGKVLQGLEKRRSAETDLYFS